MRLLPVAALPFLPEFPVIVPSGISRLLSRICASKRPTTFFSADMVHLAVRTCLQTGGVPDIFLIYQSTAQEDRLKLLQSVTLLLLSHQAGTQLVWALLNPLMVRISAAAGRLCCAPPSVVR